MNINIRLGKNFVTQYNKLQGQFGTDIARINGFDDPQLSYTDFIDNFIDEATVADVSIDGSSNATKKDIVSLFAEMPKPHRKLLAFNKIYYEIQKKYGFKAANTWLRMEWMGQLYMHDADTSTFKHYCFAYDLKDLAERGLYFIDGPFNDKPAKHLEVFVDFVKEFINYTSNRSSGAVGLPNLIPYMYYFWKMDIDKDYLGIASSGNEQNYARQNFQRFIYAVNQPYTRDGQQSAFTNTSIFDRPYFEALFGGSEFPDGSFMIDYEEEIIDFQRIYMEEMAHIREENMFTFPVSTISLLRQNGEFVDKPFAEWAIRHNMKWNDSNIFVDDSVNSLSNCCRLKSDIRDLGIGVYETMKKFGYTRVDEFGNTFYTDEALAFGQKIFETMRAVADRFIRQNHCDYMINTEQIPGESAAAKLIKKDKFFYPNANIYDLPLYGNQFMPLGIKTTLQERIKVQAIFDRYCNGGSILHANIDAPFDSFEKAWKMVNYIADQGVTYFAFNTKIQACIDNHAFYGTTCPICGKPIYTEYTRIVGFYTPIKTWSRERKQEYGMRRWEAINATSETL